MPSPARSLCTLIVCPIFSSTVFLPRAMQLGVSELRAVDSDKQLDRPCVV